MTRLRPSPAAPLPRSLFLPFIEPNYAQARQIEPDDKRLKTEKIEFAGPQGNVKAYVALPRRLKKAEKVPGILVIHENRGLNEHIEDVARRAALDGYFAIAPDGLSVCRRCTRRPGGRTRPVRQRPTGAHRGDILAGVPWLAEDPLRQRQDRCRGLLLTAVASRCARH